MNENEQEYRVLKLSSHGELEKALNANKAEWEPIFYSIWSQALINTADHFVILRRKQRKTDE